jgi:secretion/DNA translocation related TadE-like protein
VKERGNVAILMLAVIVIAGACCIGVLRVANAAKQHARLESAADAAALAAADELALAHDGRAAFAAAQRVARANGVSLVDCTCIGASAQVTVQRGRERARARAEVTTRTQDRTFRHYP